MSLVYYKKIIDAAKSNNGEITLNQAIDVLGIDWMRDDLNYVKYLFKRICSYGFIERIGEGVYKVTVVNKETDLQL